MKEIVERLRFLASGQDDPQSVALDEAANEIERQFIQVAALIDLADMLRKDAARYQWLKDRVRIEDRDGGYTGFYRLPFVDAWDDTPYSASRGKGFRFATLDAAIDAAIKVSGG